MGEGAALAGWWAWFVGSGIPDRIGMLGVVLYIGSYLCLQLGLVKGEGYLYPFLNLCASSSVLISLSTHFNPYSAVIESSWIAISLIGMARIYYVHHYIRLTDEEAEVVRRLVPGLKNDRARQFVRLGRFVAAEPGLVLAAEGEPVPALAMLLGGRAAIVRGAAAVAEVGAGALVGELTFATGAPATATVRVSAPGRVWLAATEGLLRHLARNPDVAGEMERSIAGDLRAKLVMTTDLLSARMGEAGVAQAGTAV